MDVELVARTSFSSLQKYDDGFIVSPDNLEDWTWSNLRRQFKHKGLEKLYSKYHSRLQNGYFSLFIILQLILGFSHCGILIASVKDLKALSVDLAVHGVINAILFPIVALTYRKKLINKKPYLPVVFSCIITILLVIGDIVVPVYYTVEQSEENFSLRPAYSTYSLLCCYILLPLTDNLHAFILGVTISTCYIAHLGLGTYRNSPDYKTKILTDVIYYAAVNGLGLYFRFMNEVMIRRSFLDRRKCVESTLRLNYEKDQEEQLTRSILPPHFAAKIKKDFRDIFKFIEEHKKPPPQRKWQKDLYVEYHENVSILYADVVNFSGLTVTLPVKKIVETLNDLFGRFDEASERHNVLRIKFLGDCYYCVSGVPVANPQHAKSCVDLGLDMIKIINEIRARVQRECGVDVNMRIGVHSGKIFSGILGANKWQYDVWSRDVVVANKMEQTGEPGKVHITRQTLDLLDSSKYDCKPVNRAKNEVLQRYGIFESYLITPAPSNNGSSGSSSNDCNCAPILSRQSSFTEISDHQQTRPLSTAIFFKELNKRESKESISLSPAPLTPTPSQKHYVRWSKPTIRYSTSSSTRTTRRHTSTMDSQVDVLASSYRRRTHFMDSCLRDYHLMLKAADAEMEKAIEHMPITKWEQWFKWKHINPLLLTFARCSWEKNYLKEPDPLFKFYVACSTVILLIIGIILAIPTFSHARWQTGTLLSYGVALLFLIILIPVTWTQFLWNRYKDPYDEYEGNAPQPKNKLLLFFYQTSVKIIWSEPLRMALYFVIVIMLAMCGVFNLMFECKSQKVQTNITSSVADKEPMSLACVSTPWQFTQTCSLAILASFLFLRIHFILKLITGTSIFGFYRWNVLSNRKFIFEGSETWNPELDAIYAHVLTIFYLTFSLHLIDRQTEYLNRLDYHWKRQLTKEQDEAFHTRNANKLLLRNILPEHVADFYLNMNRTDESEFYHEAHDNVAVMFASLADLSIEESNILAGFNEIVCQFDRLLFEPEFNGRIEKIKLAGTTYMAACGLEVSRRDSTQSYLGDVPNPQYNVVQLMVLFATKMMATLEKIQDHPSKKGHKHKLRIGIAHGEITAGVVGAQKPLYDIWGDAVNMASRMDTTGLAGKIQVTKETAKTLTNESDIKVELRGETYVKPKGNMITYFVSLKNDKKDSSTKDEGSTSTQL